MPQAIPMVLMIAAAAVKTGWVAYALYAAALASSYFIAKMTAPGSAKVDALGSQINGCDTAKSLPLVYGRSRVGINKVYKGTNGSDNKYLHIIGTLCEGEIEGIVQEDGVDQIFLDDKLYTAYGNRVYYEIFNGSATQNVCSTLHNAIWEWNDPLRNTAYIYIRLQYDMNKFQGEPEVTVEIDGLKVYNPATGLTAYSQNPALCARDFLVRSSRRGGMGYAASRIDDTSITDAAAYCTAKGWLCDLVINNNQPAVDNFSDILGCFRGALIYSANKFKLKYRDLNYEAVSMSLTDDDIIEKTLSVTQPDIFGTPNALVCKYPDAEKKYQITDFTFPDSTAIAVDGDYREETVNLLGVKDLSNVQRLAAYFLERMRINKTADLMTGSRGIALEPHDLVTLTASRTGWEAKQFRVTSAQMHYSGEVALGLEEEYSSFYDDVYNPQAHSWHDTTLPDPGDTIPSVTSVSITEETYSYRGRSFTRVKVDFDPPAEEDYPWWDYANIYISLDGGGTWKFATKATSDYLIDPVEEGKTYYCKIQSVNIWGAVQDFGDAYSASLTVTGRMATAPGNLASLTATAHGDAVAIMASPLTDPDIDGYEIRLGDSWSGGMYIGFNETPNIRLVGVRPGTHTFWAAAKNNAGLYSSTPVSVQVTVFYPANYTDKNTWAWDYDAIGTFDNTEHETYESGDALKCSHTDNVLTGTWTSPEYDLGSVKTVRVWGDFLHAFSAGSLTWANVFPDIWSDEITASTKWYELLGAGVSGQIKARLYWGNTSGSLTNHADNFEILAPEITARYVKVVITMTDPDAGSNMHLRTLNMKAAYWS
jgi:hypothetical protein